MINLLKAQHQNVSNFLIAAGKTDNVRESYLPTQFKCYIEELEETIKTLTSDSEIDLEQLCDDIGDVLFSGIGVIYCIDGDGAKSLSYDMGEDWLGIDLGNSQTALEWSIDTGKELLANDGVSNHNNVASCVFRGIAAACSIAKKFEIDAEEVLEIVITANMSKFDTTVENANITRDQYAEQGIAVDYRSVGNLYVTFSIQDQTVDGKEIPAGKILKSHMWSEPTYGYADR